MSFYIAVDIGCLECCEDSALIGVFADKSSADDAAEAARVAQMADWHGQHYFEVWAWDGEVRP